MSQCNLEHCALIKRANSRGVLPPGLLEFGRVVVTISMQPADVCSDSCRSNGQIPSFGARPQVLGKARLFNDYGCAKLSESSSNDPKDQASMTISEIRELLNGCQARFENLGRRL
jgi:hypothetical protein